MSLRPFIAPFVVVAVGCASAPPVETPQLDVAVPDAWTAADTSGGEVAPDWWSDFGAPDLSAAVEAALEQNFDLVAAAARLEQAAADARIASSALQPTVQASYNSSRRKQNFVGFPIPGLEGRVLSTVSTNQGVSLDRKSVAFADQDVDMIFLYRRPILEYCADTGEDFRHVVRHVMRLRNEFMSSTSIFLWADQPIK